MSHVKYSSARKLVFHCSVAVCCSVLQYDAVVTVCCSLLQYITVRCFFAVHSKVFTAKKPQNIFALRIHSKHTFFMYTLKDTVILARHSLRVLKETYKRDLSPCDVYILYTRNTLSSCILSRDTFLMCIHIKLKVCKHHIVIGPFCRSLLLHKRRILSRDTFLMCIHIKLESVYTSHNKDHRTHPHKQNSVNIL